ncbi:MAG: flavin reductase [Lewinellaceae bacterium]|nr:flavin reductase [Lewinellaceae bacterium]
MDNNTTKDTLEKCSDTCEVVINVVPYDIVRQMASSAVEHGADISEFEKAYFTPLASEFTPFRVAESPVQMECKVEQILPWATMVALATPIIYAASPLMHISESVLSDSGRIDPHKIDLMGRKGPLLLRSCQWKSSV